MKLDEMGEEFILSACGGESDLDQNQQVNKGRREQVLGVWPGILAEALFSFSQCPKIKHVHVFPLRS